MTAPVLAITGYSVLVAFHVIFVVAMLGVTFLFPFIGMKSRANPIHATFALGLVEFAQRCIVFPGAALVFLTGMWAVSAGGFSFGDGWISASFALFFIVIGISAFVTYPAAKAAKAEAEKNAAAGGGQPSPEFLAAARKLRTHGPVLSLLTLTIVFLMETKPF